MSDPDDWIGTPIEDRYQAGMRIAADARYVRARLAASTALRIAHALADQERAAHPGGDPMWELRGQSRRRDTFALPHPEDFTGTGNRPREFPGLFPAHIAIPGARV